ncbi:MAG: diguanylate cyclase [Oscillospiraceae bacterium]|nr:diguanylate cyclase [Oscillospiraceae bacterium]
MRTIRGKITAMTVAAILVCVAALGSISIFSIKSVGDRSSAREMELLCENTRRSIDEYLNSIRQSVDMVSLYAGENISAAVLRESGASGLSGLGDGTDNRDWNSSRQQKLDVYLSAHLERVEDLFRSVASHTNGVEVYYYRISQDISRQAQGFLYSGIDGGFQRVELTDLSAFDPDDVSRVGWYYLPLREGKAIWLDPYFNENLGIRMISYVSPVYVDGTFVGVIGMDINYATLIAQIDNIRLFDTGYVCLASQDGTVEYHPSLLSGTNVAELSEAMAEVNAAVSTSDRSENPIRYTDQGIEKQLCFDTLSNGLKLLVVAPVREINHAWLQMSKRIFFASVVILAVFVAAEALMAKHVTEPIHRLAAASRELAAGDYDLKLKYSGSDEVGALTDSFRQLAEHLRIYISDLNSRIYQDAMTGVKNKGAYELAAAKLDDSIRAAANSGGKAPVFAVVMLDCNDLKTINDIHGHDKGDLYLQTACGLICDVFPHSPVFRVGGDEFTVLLQGDTVAASETLFQEFDRRAAETNAGADQPWERISIAKGCAVYDPEKDADAEDVLARADEAMYENKRLLKAGRECR